METPSDWLTGDALETLIALDGVGPEDHTAGDADLVGLNLYECVRDLVRHPELMPRVRKVIAHEAHLAHLTHPRYREVLAQMQHKLYFPELEGRKHQMPAGNPHYRVQGMVSRWWITNLNYRKVLIRKLRELAAELRGRA